MEIVIGAVKKLRSLRPQSDKNGRYLRILFHSVSFFH